MMRHIPHALTFYCSLYAYCGTALAIDSNHNEVFTAAIHERSDVWTPIAGVAAREVNHTRVNELPACAVCELINTVLCSHC